MFVHLARPTQPKAPHNPAHPPRLSQSHGSWRQPGSWLDPQYRYSQRRSRNHRPQQRFLQTGINSQSINQFRRSHALASPQHDPHYRAMPATRHAHLDAKFSPGHPSSRETLSPLRHPAPQAPHPATLLRCRRLKGVRYRQPPKHAQAQPSRFYQKRKSKRGERETNRSYIFFHFMSGWRNAFHGRAHALIVQGGGFW